MPAYSVLSMSSMCSDEGTTLDGGDVLFTGFEVFVGLSERTTENGIKCLREAFKPLSIPVHSIEMKGLPQLSGRNMMHSPPLHLKSLCSIAGPGRIIVGGPYANMIKSQMRAASQLARDEYEYFEVPDEGSANCVFINGHLLRRSRQEFPKSETVFCSNEFSRNSSLQHIELEGSELAKLDGALTCCSLLLT